jgi:hypothetical protein
MSDIPLHKLRPGRKTRIEDLGLALSPDSPIMSRTKTAATVAFQKNRRYERYADVVEQEEERGLLDDGEFENPITVCSTLTPLLLSLIIFVAF